MSLSCCGFYGLRTKAHSSEVKSIKNFYSDVKMYILAKSNEENPGSIEAIRAKAVNIHQGTLPKELQGILDKL